MSKPENKNLDRVFEVYVLIKQAPRTVPELRKMLNHSKHDTLQSWIDAMERNGLVRENGVRQGSDGGPARIWESTN